MTGENKPPPIPTPERSGGGWAGFLLLALAPIPLGLLIDPLKLFNLALSHGGQDPTPLIVFHVLTMLCCMTGGIGMCGGFKKGKLSARIAGVGIGLILWIMDASIVLFVGCCVGLSKI